MAEGRKRRGPAAPCLHPPHLLLQLSLIVQPACTERHGCQALCCARAENQPSPIQGQPDL